MPQARKALAKRRPCTTCIACSQNSHAQLRDLGNGDQAAGDGVERLAHVRHAQHDARGQRRMQGLPCSHNEQPARRSTALVTALSK